jgi:hypothetical protein
MKGLIFAGCSFTWGQGLYYYSGFDTLLEPDPDCYDSSIVTDAHKRYMETLRYPRLVANKFNTFEIVSKQNGGSEETSIDFINSAFDKTDSKSSFLIDQTFSYSEIEYVIIQTSQANRNGFYYNYENRDYKFLIHEKSTKGKFYEWLIEERKITIDEWFEEHKENYINKIKSLMKFLESKGIKTKILSWENDYLDLIRSDIFLYNRFISFEYRGKPFDSIRDMMTTHPHLTINSDYDNFSNPPKDHHPSKECHEIMAKAVINSIEKDIENSKDSYVFDGTPEAIKDFTNIKKGEIKRKVKSLI